MDLDSILSRYKSIGIAGHIHPDGDCVGSCLGLYNYIKTYYKETEVKVFLEDIPDIFYFLTCSNEIMDATEYKGEPFNLFISLDCADVHRLGDAAELFKSAGDTLCIDHHVSNRGIANTNHILPDISSTSEMICELIPAEKLTKEIAECLYVGMVHDTGVFQYSATTSHTMELAGRLMDCGIDHTRIIEDTYYEKTYVQNRLLGLALLNSSLYCDGKIIASIISQKDFDSLGADTKDTEGIVSQLRVTKDSEVAVLLYQNKDRKHKVSLRCKGDYNMADIAVTYGGGGHAKAAGFNVGTDAEAELEKIIEKIRSNTGL